ncbi:hypothetical protein Q3G72_016914 [Acer saccharum]|nr:hypothetical protein Q3G72_016914 [Acer saccharum]
MWKRSAQLKSLAALWRSSDPPNLRRRSLTSSSPSTTAPSSHRTPPLFPHQVASASDKNLKTKVEDIIPIATGHELEELQAELEGRNILQINHPTGPFGTKEQPAIVKSVYDKRIVGCPGGEEEDEHDVVWFWLEKGKQHECPVCSQYFMLEVVGPGGSPDGHGDHNHH